MVLNHSEDKQGPGATLDAAIVARQASVGLQLTLPLWSGSAVNAKVREAASMLAKAEQDLESARRRAQAQTIQAWNTMQAYAVR